MWHRIFGLFNTLFGLAGLALSVGMVPAGGAASVFGVLRVAVALALVAGGVQLVRRRDGSGARLCVVHALGWIALNVVEPAVLGYPFSYALVGSAWPVVLLTWAAVRTARAEPDARRGSLAA